MTTTKKLFELTQLAEASYGNFLLPNPKNALLFDLNLDPMFSSTQADEFLENWSVAAHQSNTLSGFSATLFEDKTASGSYTLAIRGTELFSDTVNDLISADVDGIVVLGAAFNQIVDLYNYWQQLITPTTEHYQHADLVVTTSLLTAPAPPADSYFYHYQSNNLNYYVGFSKTTSTDFGLGELSPTAKVDVTGHSLGGHLAMAFARLFPDNTAEILTVNGAGFGGSLLDSFFNQLAGHTTTFDKATENSNLFGERGPEIITSDVIFNQYGERGAVAIESATHSSSAVTDSLAVANLFMQLDASLANQAPAQALSTLNALFEKGSNQADQSLEKLVEGLSQIILGTKPSITIDDRESLYVAMKALNDSTAFQSLIGNVTIEAAPTSASEARDDLGSFLSLYYLTPFALKVNDAGALNSLYEANDAIADLWNADRNLTAEQIANGEANFSDQWLNDRAGLLKALVYTNANDTSHVLSPKIGLNILDSVDYIDDSSDTTIHAQSMVIGFGAHIPARKIRFGSNAADEINGSDRNDHLFGMAGDDNDWRLLA